MASFTHVLDDVPGVLLTPASASCAHDLCAAGIMAIIRPYCDGVLVVTFCGMHGAHFFWKRSPSEFNRMQTFDPGFKSRTASHHGWIDPPAPVLDLGLRYDRELHSRNLGQCSETNASGSHVASKL